MTVTGESGSEKHDSTLVSAWLDGELSHEDAERVGDHVVSCESCGELARELRSLAARIQVATEADPSFVTRFRARREELSVAPWWTWRQLALRLAPVALAMLLAALAAVMLAPEEAGGLRELELEALGDPSALGSQGTRTQEPVLRIALEPFPGEVP